MFKRLDSDYKIYDWLTMAFEVKHMILSRPKLNSAWH